MKQHSIFIIVASACLFAAVSCATVPDPESVPKDLTVPELNRMAQDAIDNNNDKAAEVYYTLITDRFGSDPAILTAAEFEIAHIRIKNEKYPDAAQRLQTIIARYEATGGAGLPPEYLVLARNDLAKVPPRYLAQQEQAAPAE